MSTVTRNRKVELVTREMFEKLGFNREFVLNIKIDEVTNMLYYEKNTGERVNLIDLNKEVVIKDLRYDSETNTLSLQRTDNTFAKISLNNGFSGEYKDLKNIPDSVKYPYAFFDNGKWYNPQFKLLNGEPVMEVVELLNYKG